MNMELMKTKGFIGLNVQICNTCGYTVADPEGKLDPYHYMTFCPRCRSTCVTYRGATKFQRYKATLGMMPVYKQ